MTSPPTIPGFDGLMTLSRREGVDIRPTLLRVLTDLYVQAPSHTTDEEKQFVELASRLIDQVDDATRAAVRARLSIYPNTPQVILGQLALRPAAAAEPAPLAPSLVPESPAPTLQQPAPPPSREISNLFFAANASERAKMLHNLADTPLQPSARIPQARAERAMHILEMAAFAEDRENFAREIGEALMLPMAIADQVVNDPGGEPLACCAKALGMHGAIFQRVLLFLNPEFGTSVNNVYRLSRMYDVLTERAALIMVAAWRGAHLAATRAKFRPALYDDERQRARAATPTARPSVQPGMQPGVDITRTRNNSGS